MIPRHHPLSIPAADTEADSVVNFGSGTRGSCMNAINFRQHINRVALHESRIAQVHSSRLQNDAFISRNSILANEFLIVSMSANTRLFLFVVTSDCASPKWAYVPPVLSE